MGWQALAATGGAIVKKAFAAAVPVTKSIILYTVADALGDEAAKRIGAASTPEQMYALAKQESPSVAEALKPLLNGDVTIMTPAEVGAIQAAAAKDGFDSYASRRLRHRSVVAEIRAELSSAGMNMRQIIAIVRCITLMASIMPLATAEYPIDQLLADG